MLFSSGTPAGSVSELPSCASACWSCAASSCISALSLENCSVCVWGGGGRGEGMSGDEWGDVKVGGLRSGGIVSGVQEGSGHSGGLRTLSSIQEGSAHTQHQS